MSIHPPPLINLKILNCQTQKPFEYFLFSNNSEFYNLVVSEACHLGKDQDISSVADDIKSHFLVYPLSYL